MKRFACLALVSLLAACPGESESSDSDSDNDGVDSDTPSDIDGGSDTPDAVVAGCDDGETRCADDDTLETCAGGEFRPSDCAGIQECRVQGDGAACLDPVQPGQFVVTGKVQYEDKEPKAQGQTAPLGPLRPLPARAVTVAVIRDGSTAVLATGYTAYDGTYTLAYSAPAGQQVHVLASTTSTVPARPWRVTIGTDGAGAGSVHGFGGASFPAAPTATSNLLVTEASGRAGAFNIFDQMVLSGDALMTRMGVTALVPLTARWSKNSQDGTYYNGAEIRMLGANSDDDGYDDAVIIHEIGHYVEDKYGRSDSPGGGHDGSPTDPKLAWSEGFATYFSSTVRNNVFYMDSNVQGGFNENIDTGVTVANPSGNQNQNVGEGMISQILWDVGDAPSSDDDARSGVEMHTEVLKVQPGFLASGTGAKGVPGVDLVDWFHGFVSLNGTGACAGLKAIAAQHTFPISSFGCP